ncbi:hypothetical protein RUM43_010265 [Polyplax serrata]|uniref:F-box domain-containing protein n=1 Tax=Polyplax serrata TaxID=468196 RepID=A0AAN8P050_POLSC
MDEKNGEVFEHHSELFAQVGSVLGSGTLKNVLVNPSGMTDSARSAKTGPLPVSQASGMQQENIWTQGFPCNESLGLTVQNKSVFNLQLPESVDILPNEVVNTSALLDNLVKNIPATEGANANQYTTAVLPSKNVGSKSTTSDNVIQGTNPLLSGLCRINSEKVTQDLLENFNKLESNDMLLKCSDYENLPWNGLICDPINSANFQSQNHLPHGLQSSIDKNGNSALFGTSQIDKINSGSNPSEHFTQNNFLARLSPSASVETCVRTPATSYESASPLSNNRTPIRSDESISPMGSGHTPLRIDESTSPLTNMKTPLRIEEGSPMGRTPHRVDESFSPLGSSSITLTSGSPSHKTNGQTQCFDSYSPPSLFKKSEGKNLTLGNQPSSSKSEASEDKNVKEEKDEVTLTETTSSVGGALKAEQGVCSFGESDDKDVNSLDTIVEALTKQQVNKKLPIPFVCAKRLDESLVNRKSGKRTLSKKSDGETIHLGSSSLSGTREGVPKSNEACNVKTELTNEVPEVERNELRDDAQKLSQPEDVTYSDEFYNKSKRRRKKSDAMCLPSIKRRSRKRVTIYQSSMSPEESGIKLKIKVASAFQRMKPQKKRRSKKHYGSDEEEGSESKRSKKYSRSSNSTKESETSEQTEWGSKIPPEVLHRIFEFVVEDQGCVPSLVRFSSVCKLWNTVANRTELWQNIDLSSPYIKQKCKIDRYFRWLLENRLENIRELNLSGWKFSNITMVLSLIGTHCTDIESIGLAGWQGLHYEHLKALLQDCPRLGKLDLSDVSPESKSANSAVSQKSITFLTQTMGERLTQLILAHNTLTCLPQIISSLATHCPNLQVLDLSNIRRVSHTEFALNIEHLQEGCQKLKVLRITNSCITLANVPLDKQVASPGFTNLEELSIASHQGTECLRITSVMDDSCLERILKTSHKLKLLDVRGCTRVTDSSLVRVPAWDIQHLFLSGCYVTRQSGSGLDLIAQKWSHSLVEIDLAWTTVTDDLNAAIMAFAEKGSESPLRVMNLCGSSVTLEPVKALLSKCGNLESLNLQSCRGLPRGVKRLYENEQLMELRTMLEKRDRDSVSESEDRRESECEGRTKGSPMYSTNNKSDDLFT